MEINWTELIIGLASLVVTVFLVPYLRAKYQEIRTDSIDYWLRVLMSSAETYFASGTGAQKKEWVLTELKARFPSLDMDRIQDSLESMFRELVVEGILNNDEFK